MNAQEIFDTVVTHLRKQNARSVDAEGSCVYRSSSGLRCAIGCLIPDEEYKSSFEARDVAGLMDHIESNQLMAVCPVTYNALIQDYDLISDLQRVHDSEAAEDWEDHFKQVAISFNLRYTRP